MPISLTSRSLTVAAGTVLGAAGTAVAASPELELTLRLDGAVAHSGPLAAGFSSGDVTSFSGSLAGDDWSLDWSLEARALADDAAWIDGVTTFANVGGEPRVVELELRLPVCPGLDGESQLGGGVDVSLTAGGDGATLSVPAGASLWTARLDGVPSATLFDGPFFLMASGAGSMGTDDSFGLPAPSQPAGAVVDAATTITTFTLTGGDIARVDQLLVVGPDAASEPVACAAPDPDLDGNGRVDFFDLMQVLMAWGACEGACPEDLTLDTMVDLDDILELLASWSR